MFSKKLLILLIFLSLLAIPISFAGDVDNNQTTSQIICESESQEIISTGINENESVVALGNTLYFDASASSEGTGSQSSPYKTFSASKLGFGDVSCYFAPGTYTFSDSASFFYGSLDLIGTSNNPSNTILKYTGSDNIFGSGMSSVSSVNIKGITLSGLTLQVNSAVDISNSIIENGKGIENDKGNTYGGVISFSSSSSKLTVDKTIFRNNNAEYGGVIYMKYGTATITNSKFVNNSAIQFGGTIAAESGANVIVKNCEFDGANSEFDAGASLYIKNAQATVSYSNFTGSNSYFGPAVTGLNSTLVLDHIMASNNEASFEGGAVYAMYGSLKVTSSTFNSNSAKYGGAIFADNLTYFECTDSIFNENSATNTAGAIYALANLKNTIVNPLYSGNKAGKENNYYESKAFDLNIVHNDIEQMITNPSSGSVLPSKYDLRDYGQVSSIRNQGDSGNCWAYATLAALESAILKATGNEYDLSEGNLKNLAQIFSDYGWSYETNEGGFYRMATGYLTGWLGPVLESQDLTDDKDFISAVFDGLMHVQNIVYIQRTSYTDNDAIKRAIMDYGAVATEIYFANNGYYYSPSNGAYYYYDGNEINHAVAIVGWDDNYSRNNFARTPAGDGAFIIKNSYGNQWGKDYSGFGYVSYYDTAFARFNIPYSTFAFMLNDTAKFNKNYQYETTSWTDYFVTGKDTIYYKNEFTSTGNDFLSAFSTYFNATNTKWEANIYVNDNLVLTQSGVSPQGYYTINLDSQIPLKTGDRFAISLKISCNGMASFPISEYTQYGSTRMNYIPGVSFFSYDCETWYDLYDYKVDEILGHRYSSQVACIKAFTTSGGDNSSIKTNIEINEVDSNHILATVKTVNNVFVTQGNVTFNINGNITTVSLNNGVAELKSYLKPGSYHIDATYNGSNDFDSSTTSKDVLIAKESLNIAIDAADIYYGQDLLVNVTLTNSTGCVVKSPVTVIVDGKAHLVIKGSLSIPNLKPGNYTIIVKTAESDEYGESNSTVTVSVLKINTILTVNADDIIFGENASINVNLENVYDDIVKISVGGKNYDVNITNQKGLLNISNLGIGNYDVFVVFEGNDYYLTAYNSTKFTVSQVKPMIKTNTSNIEEGETALINVELNSDINGALTVHLDGKQYLGFINNGKSTVKVSNLKAANYTYTVTYNGDDIYTGVECNGSFEVIKKNSTPDTNDTNKSENTTSVNISAPDVIKYYGGSERFIVKASDSSDNPLENITVNILINGNTYTRITDNQGVASIAINLNSGSYNVVTTCGNITLNSSVTIKDTVFGKDLIKVYRNNSQYTAEFIDAEGNLITNQNVTFNINGIFYERKTNESGIARLNINLAQGNYIITALNPLTKEQKSNEITVIPTIDDNHDLIKYYKNDSQYSVRLLNDDGSYAGANENVTFNINGVFYERKTDSAGYAKLNINLAPGEYIITVDYKNCKISNNITVLSVLEADDLNMQYKDGSTFKVKVLNGHGNPFVNEKITFNINGVFYEKYTDSNGIASLNINLQKGEYIITSTYNGLNIANTIKID